MASAFTPKFADLVRNYTSTDGTADFDIGPPVNGFTSFKDAVQVGDRFYYSAAGIDFPGETEVGRGTLVAGGLIAREPLRGPKTKFSTGLKSIALVASADWYAQVQDRSVAQVATRADMASAPTAAPVLLTEQGREGLFAFDAHDLSAAVAADGTQGIYVATAADPSGASGAWVRLFSGPVDPCWWGVTAGPAMAAHNSAARDAMFAILRARATTVLLFVQSLEPIRFRAETYDFDSTFELTDGTFIIEGAGHGMTGGVGTALRFPEGVTGIRVQGEQTAGATGTRAPGRSASGSTIRNLTILSSWSADGVAHGVHLRATASVEDCHIDGFNGDGVHIDGNPPANANVWQLRTVTAVWCRNGIFVDGPDGNAGTCVAASVTNNRQWGIYDSSFLGNSYIGCHAADNVAGPYKSDSLNASNLFLNCYSESGQPPASFVSPTLVVGGAHGAGTGDYAGVIAVGIGGQLELTGLLRATQPITQTASLMLSGNAGGVQTIRAGGTQSRLAFEQTGGSLGTSRLIMSAEVGALGATFETTHATAQLVDFAFQTSAAGSHGIRYERRSGNYVTAGTSSWEFQIGTPGAAIHGISDAGMKIRGTGAFTGPVSAASVEVTGRLTSSGGAVGYAAGAGGAATQTASKSTAVTINKPCGQITTNGASLAAGAIVSFTVNNNFLTATDTVTLNLASGFANAGSYRHWVEGNSAGSFKIVIENRSAAALAEALVFNFAILKAVAA